MIEDKVYAMLERFIITHIVFLVLLGFATATAALAAPINPNEALRELQRDVRQVIDAVQAVQSRLQVHAEVQSEQRILTEARLAVIEQRVGINSARLDRIEQFGVGLLLLNAGAIASALWSGARKR